MILITRLTVERRSTVVRCFVTGGFFLLLLAACEPKIGPEELRPLAALEVSGYQDAVRDQISAAYKQVQDQPIDAQANGMLGRVFRAYRDYASAEIAFGRARRLAPREVDWMYLHGEVLQQLGRYPEAIEAMQAVLKSDSSDIPAQLRLGELLLENGEVEAASKQLQKMVKAIPNYSAIHSALARVHERNGDVEQAIKSWQSALEFGGAFGQGHYALAQLYRRLGRQEDAAFHLTQFNQVSNSIPGRLDPRIEQAVKLSVSDRPLLLAARTAKANGDHQKALRLLEQASARNPSNVDTYASLVAGYAAAGRYDEAQKSYAQGIAIDVNNVELKYSLGRLRQRQGRTQEAAELLLEVTQKSPGHSMARAWLGNVQESVGEVELAGATYKLAVSTDPENVTARQFYTNWLVESAKPERALEELDGLLKVATTDAASIHLALATVHVQQNNSSAALVALNKGIELANRIGQPALSATMQQLRASLLSESERQ